MLTVQQILDVGRMMYQCGEGPLQTEGHPQSPITLETYDPTKPPKPGTVRVRLFHVLNKDGGMGIQNITDDEELAKLRAEKRIAE